MQDADLTRQTRKASFIRSELNVKWEWTENLMASMRGSGGASTDVVVARIQSQTKTGLLDKCGFIA